VATAVRTISSPVIDGYPLDAEWNLASPASDFIQNSTRPGSPCTQKTEVKILYDDVAIYVLGYMYDSAPDSILKQMSIRDKEENTDVFGIIFDTYKDGRNAYGFYVTAAGVQLDARYSNGIRDLTWNVAWQSRVKIIDNGWVVELKIPFSAIRFPQIKNQEWGVNFLRKIRRQREISYWNFVNPAIDGFTNQFGILTGISDIVSPLRLALIPYSSAYADLSTNEEGVATVNSNLNFGADLKYGINESFTIDMTLVPDFGQVQSDNLVLNLTPFEIEFIDYRPFFTEGTELFNRGGLFYSRRVGGTPKKFFSIGNELNENEVLVQNPFISQLINASKFSGRTDKGLGIGVFNGLVNRTFAIAEDTITKEKRNLLTNPISNYNVFVLDQSFKNNSYLSFVNTNVHREGSDFYNANVAATQFRFLDSTNTYEALGNVNWSRKYGGILKQDVDGLAYDLSLAKISGNFQYYAKHWLRSDKYDPTDMGFLLTNNQVYYNSGLGYNIFKPFWKLNNLFTNLDFTYSRAYNPNQYQDFSIYGESWTTLTKQFFSTGLSFSYSPFKRNDFFEPRTPGYFLIQPNSIFGRYWFSSDYRKRFALDGSTSFVEYGSDDRKEFYYEISPRFRLNDRIMLIHAFENELKWNDIGFVGRNNTDIMLGRREINTIINTFTSEFSFNELMFLSFRLRHYWSSAKYTNYYVLQTNGEIQASDIYAVNHDINFNVFNIDMVYTWVFAPASEIRIVWKNSILTQDKEIIMNYTSNFQNTVAAPQLNSFSIKFLYYIDYLYFKGLKLR
jgi:hypothetical protein